MQLLLISMDSEIVQSSLWCKRVAVFFVVRKGDWKSKLETLMRSCFRLCVNAAGAVKRRISHDSCSWRFHWWEFRSKFSLVLNVALHHDWFVAVLSPMFLSVVCTRTALWRKPWKSNLESHSSVCHNTLIHKQQNRRRGLAISVSLSGIAARGFSRCSDR